MRASLVDAMAMVPYGRIWDAVILVLQTLLSVVLSLCITGHRECFAPSKGEVTSYALEPLALGSQ